MCESPLSIIYIDIYLKSAISSHVNPSNACCSRDVLSLPQWMDVTPLEIYHQIEEQIAGMVRFTFINPRIIGSSQDDGEEFIDGETSSFTNDVNEEKVMEMIVTEEGNAFIDTRFIGSISSQDECDDESIDVGNVLETTTSDSKDDERSANNGASILLLSPLATSWKSSAVRAKENLNRILSDIEQLGTDVTFPPTPRGRLPSSSSKQQHTPAFAKGVAKTISSSRSSSSDKEQQLMGEEEVGVNYDRNQLIELRRTLAEKQRRIETAFAEADRVLGTKGPQQNKEDNEKSTLIGNDKKSTLVERILLARGQRMQQQGRGTGGGAIQDRRNKARQKVQEGKLKVRRSKEGDKLIIHDDEVRRSKKGDKLIVHDDEEENVDQKKNKDMAMITPKEIFVEEEEVDQKMDEKKADDKHQSEGDDIVTDETIVDKCEDRGVEEARSIDVNGDSKSAEIVTDETVVDKCEDRGVEEARSIDVNGDSKSAEIVTDETVVDKCVDRGVEEARSIDTNSDSKNAEIVNDETIVDNCVDRGVEEARSIDTNSDSEVGESSVHTINERMNKEERMCNPSVEDEVEEEKTKEFDVLVTDEKMREVLIMAEEKDIEITVVYDAMRGVETAASDSSTVTADLFAAVDDTVADIESRSSSTSEAKQAAARKYFEDETNRLLVERQQAVEAAVSEIEKWSKGIMSHNRKSEEAIVDKDRSKEVKTITMTVVTENEPRMEVEGLDEIEETRQQEENEEACVEESRQSTDEIEESRRLEENEDTNETIKVSGRKKRETAASMVEVKVTRKTKVDTIIAETDRRRIDDNAESVHHNEEKQRVESAVAEIEIRQKAIKEAHDNKRREHEKEMNRLLHEREKVQEQAKLVEAVMRAAVNDAKDKNAYYNILDITSTATPVQIKKAYRKLALRLHPDKLGSYSTPNSLEAFNAVACAYDVLKDVSSRREYDRQQNQCVLVSRGPYTVIPIGTHITVQSTDTRFMKLNGQQGSIMGYNAISDLYLVKVDNLAESIWSKSSALFQNVVVCLRAIKAKELGAFLVTLKAYYRDSRGGCYEVICHDDMTGMIMRSRRAYLLPDQFIIPNGTVVHVESGAFGLVVDWKEKFDHITKVDSSYYEVRLSSDNICRVLMRNIRV